MDNASIHRSKIVKDTIHQEKLKIAFISIYSPDLASIEKYFSLLKLIVIKVTQGSLVNLKSKNSFYITRKSIQSISMGTVIRI